MSKKKKNNSIRTFREIQKVEEDCFVSQVAKTVQKDKSVKNVLDQRKLNDSCIKKRPHIPNMEELFNQILTKIIRVQNEPFWIPKIELEYTYGQLKLSEATSRHSNYAVTGGNMNRYYILEKKDSSVYPIFWKHFKKKRQNIELPNTHVTRRYNKNNKGDQEKHQKKSFTYSRNFKKPDREQVTKNFVKEPIWPRHEKSEHGINPNKEKIKATLQLKSPASSNN